MLKYLPKLYNFSFLTMNLNLDLSFFSIFIFICGKKIRSNIDSKIPSIHQSKRCQIDKYILRDAPVCKLLFPLCYLFPHFAKIATWTFNHQSLETIVHVCWKKTIEKKNHLRYFMEFRYCSTWHRHHQILWSDFQYLSRRPI